MQLVWGHRGHYLRRTSQHGRVEDKKNKEVLDWSTLETVALLPDVLKREVTQVAFIYRTFGWVS